jgi:hypothetical protein
METIPWPAPCAPGSHLRNGLKEKARRKQGYDGLRRKSGSAQSITSFEIKEKALLDPKKVSPGLEQYERFNSLGRMGKPGPERCQYDYRNRDGELFSCVPYLFRSQGKTQPARIDLHREAVLAGNI